MIAAAKRTAPDMVFVPDLCFCEYTDHGHCSVLEHGTAANDATLENLARQAVVAADAGVDFVASSSMMNDQMVAIRRALDEAGHVETNTIPYSSKFTAAACAVDEHRVVRETLDAFKRAGTDLILSYFARDVVREGW